MQRQHTRAQVSEGKKTPKRLLLPAFTNNTNAGIIL